MANDKLTKRERFWMFAIILLFISILGYFLYAFVCALNNNMTPFTVFLAVALVYALCIPIIIKN